MNKIADKFNGTSAAKYIKHYRGILLAFLLLCVILSISTDHFLSTGNLVSVLRQVSINAILTFGMTLVLIIGCIDLTVGAVAAVTGCVAILLINSGVPTFAAILIVLLIGAFFGSVIGLVISRTMIPPFIVTLAMTSIIRGIGYVITGARPVRSSDPVFNQIGNGSFFNLIPIPVVIVIALLIFTSLLLGKSKFGRNMYAIGGNKEAAIYAGINVKKHIFVVYVLTGILSAIAGVVLASRIYSGQPNAGDGYEGDAIAAAVLGGVSFHGGIGSISGVVLGVLFIGVMNNGLNLLGVSFWWQHIVKGIVILVAVYIDTFKNTKRLKTRNTAKRAKGAPK